MEYIKWISFVLSANLCFGQTPWDTLTPVQLMDYILTTDGQPPTCFTGEVESFALEMYEAVALNDVSPHCLEIYIETDSFTVASLGGVTATLAWINRIETNAKIIFANEGINIRFVDPYTPVNREWSDDLTSASAILNKFGEVRKVSPGHIKHFISRRSLGGGVAWVNMLCRNSPPGAVWGPFAVSTQMAASFPDYPAYSWTIMVFCHETGHSIASPHTHDCVWANGNKIDDCVSGGSCGLIQPVERSTIMSYCHLSQYGIDFTKGFGTLPGDLLRGAINRATCISTGPDKVFLTGEVTGEVVGDTVCLNGVTNLTGNLLLRAGVVQIDSSELYPTFEIKQGGCQ